MTERRNQRRSPAAREGKLYGVYDETDVDIRGRFIIDPDFVIRAMEVFTHKVGRNPRGALRRIKRNAPPSPRATICWTAAEGCARVSRSVRARKDC